MSLVLIAVAVLVLLAALAFFVLRKPAAPPPRARPQARPQPTAAVAAVAVDAPPLAPDRPVPPELAPFTPLRAESLDEASRQALLVELRGIPRPPRAFHKLISPEFVSTASSAELAEIVTAEPLIAAKVMATVNSPFYGLQRPVASIGQAVTFLGLNSVRAICLQYMMEDSFKPGSPELRRIFDQIACASALASELCLKLAQQLKLPDPGALVTWVVLSFLGRFASAALLPRAGAVALSTQPLLARSLAEQRQLGVAAPELGALLMADWAMPQGLIDDIRAIDDLLVTPARSSLDDRGTRLALCYLSARLGERLALGSAIDLASFEPSAEQDADFFHLHGYLRAPALARLGDALHSQELVRAIHTMRGAITNRRPAP